MPHSCLSVLQPQGTGTCVGHMTLLSTAENLAERGEWLLWSMKPPANTELIRRDESLRSRIERGCKSQTIYPHRSSCLIDSLEVVLKTIEHIPASNQRRFAVQTYTCFLKRKSHCDQWDLLSKCVSDGSLNFPFRWRLPHLVPPPYFWTTTPLLLTVGPAG